MEAVQQEAHVKSPTVEGKSSACTKILPFAAGALALTGAALIIAYEGFRVGPKALLITGILAGTASVPVGFYATASFAKDYFQGLEGEEASSPEDRPVLVELMLYGREFFKTQIATLTSSRG